MPVSRKNAGVTFMGVLAVFLVANVMLLSTGCSERAPAPVSTPIPPTATAMPTPSATPDLCQSADVVSYSDAYAAYRIMMDRQLVRLDDVHATGGASLDDTAVDDVHQKSATPPLPWTPWIRRQCSRVLSCTRHVTWNRCSGL